MLSRNADSLVDTGVVHVRAGRGGRGAISFRREKFVPRGGPDGGNGGNGGHVFFRADPRKNTLIDFTRKRSFQADNGEHGGSSNRTGKDGENTVVSVPVGTVIYDMETSEMIADLDRPWSTVCVARGGKGGRGNSSFASATRQTPRHSEEGVPGESRSLRLELKLLADAAIIGMPNVGKSSFIARVSNATPKIANYHFTTIIPTLGVVEAEGTSFLLADVPGLIKGAHLGSGLGTTFLKHVERCSVLLHMVDISESEERIAAQDYADLRNELKEYDSRLIQLPEIVLGNKTDLISDDILKRRVAEFKKATGLELIPVSVATGYNIDEVLRAVVSALGKESRALRSFADEPPALPEVSPVTRTRPDDTDYCIDKDSQGRFVVSGPVVDYYTTMVRFQTKKTEELLRVLERGELTRRLIDAGISEGDTVLVGDAEFEFKY
ncbi:MAG TPA: GTPase ObgE [Kosmotogaceae bacterium]|nr:GTPase ObgE [Kosmotogaceae bacterium]